MKNNENKKFSFNVIDVIIILIILCAIGGVMLRAGIEDKISIASKSEPAEIRFLITALEHSAGDSFAEGNDVFFTSNDKKIGTLTSEKTIVPAEMFITLSDGTIIKSESPDGSKIDVRGGIEVSGVFGEDGSFMLNGNTRLAPGSTLDFHTDTITVSALITEIKQLAE